MGKRKERKPRISKTLEEIDRFVDWGALVEVTKVIDKTGTSKGGRPRKKLEMMLRILFLQYIDNLSDPETEDQVLDRRSFRAFAGIKEDSDVPVFSTLWRFRDALQNEGIFEKIFSLVEQWLEEGQLILKRGTIVDARIVNSSNRPLSQKKRELYEQQQEEEELSCQIDLEARSTQKRGKWYFGYKGHIGVDVGSELIRRRSLTSANVHDSQEKDKLFVGDEQSKHGDSAYSCDKDKRQARKDGILYAVLDKGRRNHPLSTKQKKRNKRLSKIRAQVEHPFAFMYRHGYNQARAKSKSANQAHFDMNCILYNVRRAVFLLKRRGCWT